MSIARGPWRTPAGAAELALQALDGSSSSSGSSGVARREQALRKLAWSGSSPTGSVSYVLELAVTRHAGGGQRRDRGLQLRAALADVRAEAEQRDALGHAHTRVVCSPAAANFSPTACANGTSPDIGRIITVKSAIRPRSSSRSRSIPSISRPLIAARKTSACAPSDSSSSV